AAGVSLHPENVEPLRVRLNELARRTLKPEQLQPTLWLDAEVTTADLTVERLHELEKLQQTGIGNPPAHFFLPKATHARPLQRIRAEKSHAKLWIPDGRATCEALMWGVADGPLPVGRFDLAVAPQLNEYNGTFNPQLKILDWRPTRS